MNINATTRKKQIILKASRAEERARELIECGGEVSDLETLQSLARLLGRDDRDNLEFVRDGKVQNWSVRNFVRAIEQNIEVR